MEDKRPTTVEIIIGSAFPKKAGRLSVSLRFDQLKAHRSHFGVILPTCSSFAIIQQQ